MWAIVQERYGAPRAVLATRQIARPQIGDEQALVRVCAAGLHIGDVFVVRGSPFPVRLAGGLRTPRGGVPGLDIAGTVEAVGRNVGRFAPGDAVFGTCVWPSSGACAEYASAAEDSLAPKPARLSFEEAAALPTSATAALHGLRDAGHLTAGQRVLINGASGGVGSFAVQIARAMGGEVTAVCGPESVDLVRSLGAHHVIDYTREDFTRGTARYDLILDNVENHPLSRCRGVLAPHGTLVLNSGTGVGGLGLLIRLVRPAIVSPFVPQTLRRFYSVPKRADLETLAAMVDEGTLRPAIAGTYPLREAAAALDRIEAGHVRGKVVITVPASAA